MTKKKDSDLISKLLKDWSSSTQIDLSRYVENSIHICKDAESLADFASQSAKSSTAVFNLEDIELVRFANRYTGNIRWFCKRDPRNLIGPLLDHYRGTYYREDLKQIVYSGSDELEFYDVPGNCTVTEDLLAALCAAREAGVPAHAIKFNQGGIQ